MCINVYILTSIIITEALFFFVCAWSGSDGDIDGSDDEVMMVE